MNKVLVSGGAGQLGQVFNALGAGACAEKNQLLALDRNHLDISNRHSIDEAFQQYDPTVVINAAAFTNVEQAEVEPDRAFAVNTAAAELLAERCVVYDVQLIHLSTDYVFDGQKGAAYEAHDEPNPINTYGSSKLAGERAVLAANPKAVIVRTSWLYSEFGENFQTKIIRAAKEKLLKGERLRVVADQWGSPTYAPYLMRFLLSLSQEPQAYTGNILHFSGNQVMSRLEMAEMLLSTALNRGELVELPSVVAASDGEYPTLAKRPRNSALKTSI